MARTWWQLTVLLVSALCVHEAWSQDAIRTGATGATGPRGSPGPAGPSGPSGPSGPPGSGGGPQGQVGFTGRTGATGVIGYSGYNGHRGVPGAQGLPADQTSIVGSTGSTGQGGRIGATGYRGPAGVSFGGGIGANGELGATGSFGPNGYTGLFGPLGGRGGPGMPGPIGPVGPAGPAGTPGVLITCSDTTINVPECNGPELFSTGNTNPMAFLYKRWEHLPWAKHMLNPSLLAAMFTWLILLTISIIISVVVGTCCQRGNGTSSFPVIPMTNGYNAYENPRAANYLNETNGKAHVYPSLTEL